MGDRKKLLDGICVIYFKYVDGSVIRCLCSANPDIVSCHGMMWRKDTLFDLEVRKPIPTALFDLDAVIVDPVQDVDEREPLDKFAQEYIKNSWTW